MGILSSLFSKDYKEITTEELNVMMKDKSKYQFLDVRTKQEHSHYKHLDSTRTLITMNLLEINPC